MTDSREAFEKRREELERLFREGGHDWRRVCVSKPWKASGTPI